MEKWERRDVAYQGHGTKSLKNCNSTKCVGYRRTDFYEQGCRYRLLGHQVTEGRGEETK